jgi:hypothetical protein
MALVAAASASSSFANRSTPVEVFQGHLQFSGEFTLFLWYNVDGRQKECLSGAFPLKKHLRAQKRYSGKLVRIWGRRVLYSSLVERIGATEKGWKGTPIPNYCGGDYVILAKRIDSLQGDKQN